MDHCKHQLFPAVVLLMYLCLTFRRLASGPARVRFKGFCLYVGAINRFYWDGWIYLCVVNVRRESVIVCVCVCMQV